MAGENQQRQRSFHFPSIAVKAAGIVSLIIRRVAGDYIFGNLGGNAEEYTVFRPLDIAICLGDGRLFYLLGKSSASPFLVNKKVP